MKEGGRGEGGEGGSEGVRERGSERGSEAVRYREEGSDGEREGVGGWVGE